MKGGMLEVLGPRHSGRHILRKEYRVSHHAPSSRWKVRHGHIEGFFARRE